MLALDSPIQRKEEDAAMFTAMPWERSWIY
jgi:hypothetical protein